MQRAENGQPPLGTRLTGYTAKGELVPDEAALVRQIFERFHAGDSLRGITGWLNDERVPAPREARARAAAEEAAADLAASPGDVLLEARAAQARARLSAVSGRARLP